MEYIEIFDFDPSPKMEPPPIGAYKLITKSFIFYYLNNEYHNEDGPAVIELDDNGNPESEEYYQFGKMHPSKDGVYFRFYFGGEASGKVSRESFCNYYDDSYNYYNHCETGPAWIDYNIDGSVKEKVYYLNNNRYSEKEYNEMMETKLYW